MRHINLSYLRDFTCVNFKKCFFFKKCFYRNEAPLHDLLLRNLKAKALLVCPLVSKYYLSHAATSRKVKVVVLCMSSLSAIVIHSLLIYYSSSSSSCYMKQKSNIWLNQKRKKLKSDNGNMSIHIIISHDPWLT